MPAENSKTEISELLLDDRLVRILGIPFFGLVIPSATGLIRFNEISLPITLHYLYFILLAWIIWEGNRFLLFRYYPVIFRSQSVFQKYVLMTGLNIFYSGPVSLILLFGWRWVVNANWVTDQVIINSSILIVVCVIFVTNVYEKALFVKESDNLKVIREQLERGKIQAELEALKNQIDPHFMFNTLNSISYLVEHDAEKARIFIENLAEVYRYILRSKDKNLILLENEITFMKSYLTLIELRYGEAFKTGTYLHDLNTSGYLIPPVSMMVAVENAAKHNRISSKEPFSLDIRYTDDQLIFRNRVSEKITVKESTRTGLNNLNERFKKLVGKEIGVIQDNNYFELRLPILKLTN